MSYTTTDFSGRQHIISSSGRNGSTRDRVQYLLEGDEGVRNSCNEMLIQLWMLDGLDNRIAVEEHEGVVRFIVEKATNAKSALNRYQDLQRMFDHLAPSPDVAELRQRQATQGPVR